MYKIIAPATAISVSIIMVSVAPDMASLTFPASLNLEIISPTFLVPKSSSEVPLHACNIPIITQYPVSD